MENLTLRDASTATKAIRLMGLSERVPLKEGSKRLYFILDDAGLLAGASMDLSLASHFGWTMA